MPRILIPACHRESSPTNRERSQLQEKRIAKVIGGRVQPASGARDFHKGDVKSDHYLVEAKTTIKKSYTITHGLLLKIDSEADTERKTPVLALSFEAMPAPTARDWVLIPLHEFERLKDASEGVK